MKVSHAQLNVLMTAEAGRDVTYVPLVNGKGSQSRTVGRGVSVSMCVQNGWLKWNQAPGGWHGPGEFELTDAGRAVLAAEAAREQVRKDQAMRNDVRLDAGWEQGYRCHGLWTTSSRYSPNWTPAWNGFRLGRVALGPPKFWDGTYSWLIDKPGVQGAVLAEGTATTLKDAKAAVELGVARVLRGLPIQ